MTIGTCLCGTLRYEVDGPFQMMMHCHCSMCRKHHGTAFATFVAAPIEGFRWLQGEDAVVRYASSPHGSRSFCRHCGSVAPTLIPAAGMVACPAANLQGNLDMEPQAHLFAGSKAVWDTITDSLPQYDEYPPEFGATGVAAPVRETRPGSIQGSCLCGDITYEVTGEPIRMSICHCTRCQRSRSAPYAVNVVYPEAQFKWTSGIDRIHEFKVPEAKFFTVAFCERCGSSVPRVSKERGIVVIPAGSLDSDPGVRPQSHIFVGSRAAWFTITDDLPQFPEYAP